MYGGALLASCMCYLNSVISQGLKCHNLVACRLVNGQTVESICKILHTKAVSMQSGPEFDRFREWVWRFSLKFLYLGAQVNSNSLVST